MAIELTKEEADVVVEYLKHITFETGLKNPVLMKAVIKMSGIPFDIQAYAGNSLTQNEPEIWYIEGHKISMIKAIRAITGFGLREAKEYVEAHDPANLGRVSFNSSTYKVTKGFNEMREHVKLVGCDVSMWRK